MNPSDPPAEALRWLRFAQEDLAASESTLADDDGIPRHACWLAQQAAEKAIKAALISLQLDYRRMHDLDALRNLLPEDWSVKREQPDLASLTEWAVSSRYPGDWPEATPEDARVAVTQARAVYESVLRDLLHRQYHDDDPSTIASTPQA